MNIVPYEGFNSVDEAISICESRGLSRDAVVIVKFLDAFYVVAAEGIDRNAIIGKDVSFRRSKKDGTFKVQATSDFKLSYKISKREPRRYTDTIFRELQHVDAAVSLHTVNATGAVREISSLSNVNYPVLLGLTFKRALVPIEQLADFGRSYFKDSLYLESVQSRFFNSPYRLINPFLGVAYNPRDPRDFMLYGFAHNSKKYGAILRQRAPSPFEISHLADSESDNPLQAIPREVLAAAAMPAPNAYVSQRKQPFYRRHN